MSRPNASTTDSANTQAAKAGGLESANAGKNANSAAKPTAAEQTVRQLAEQSRDEAEFLHRLATHLAEIHSAALVAVQDNSFPQPRMLVRNETIAANLDRDWLRQQLGVVSPSAASFVFETPNGQTDTRATALGVELLPAPQSAKLMLLHDHELAPTALLPAMKQLGEFAKASRERFATPTQVDSESTESSRAIATLAGELPAHELVNLDQAFRNVRAVMRGFHQDLDPTSTAYRIAADLPRLLACDRAAVLLPKTSSRRPKFQVRAISGSSVIDRRSPLIRSMNQLADAVAVIKRPLILPAQATSPNDEQAIDPAALSPQLIEPLEGYLDESGVHSVAMIPLFEPSQSDDPYATELGQDLSPDAPSDDELRSHANNHPPIAMLILETFSGDPATEISPAIREVADESALALSNALNHASVFALPLRRPLAAASRRAFRNWAMAISLSVIAGLIAGWLIRVDHHVVATGEARPAVRRAIFAGIDGIVDELLVSDGDHVQAGEMLVRLDNAELTREAEAVSGELATATQQLSSIRALLLSGDNGDRDNAQNILEQQSLENQIESLNKRLDLNQQMQSMLSIRAPFDGQVVGWRLDERLSDHPVSRGDRLLSMVQPDGPWELELKLEESRSREVLQRYSNGDPLPIRFAIETRPTETFEAEVSSVGSVARRRADGRSVLDVVAKINEVPEDGFRGDAEVTAKIVCGKKRYLASALDDVVDWVHRNVLFRFR
ncbi:biotin/lipoyl-binding protein [Rhodopirellula sp. JC740]|uniref:Biotin/lipoyl-binding protein n=1 Tax=Rhodopirellula halodulae TaxID=2894198 RepID=A0ABS8NBZ8_9BACT|nr:biotin/lipoyl-binding protein [Rhodopirellula sp. JC740]MCC9640929.1 biotin/lipoyl-binding protein [Rhodopirellula sp. JC740]